ncbi:hypothetical protein [Actinomadura atramentaria]|uniref:hypothetical protein n=1 Tax=Actinomadura atramentaria TaxID=1990 RepID=UPI000373E15C|nr:hypothetical protein [Actinomadura atramentaria]
MTQHTTGAAGSRAAEYRRITARHNAIAGIALVVGLAALVLGFVSATHFAGLVLGIIGLPVALYNQMMSVTTGQRWLNVIGMVGSFVGAGFALRHGGFSM